MRSLILALVSLSLVACSSAPSADTAASAEPIVGDHIVLRVTGLSCPQCSSNIDKTLARVRGVRSTTVDLSTGLVTVAINPDAPPSLKMLSAAVEEAGFTVAGVEG